MSFANVFKRAIRGIDEEMVYYRGFAALDGVPEQIEVLEELREKWEERNQRYEGRGRAPTEPFDWADDETVRADAKECLNKIIKVAAIAAAAKANQPQAAALDEACSSEFAKTSLLEEEPGLPEEAASQNDAIT